MNSHAFRKAASDPGAHGFPPDPRLRVPILAWVIRDPSPYAQAYARDIWNSFPEAIRAECRDVLGIDL